MVYGSSAGESGGAIANFRGTLAIIDSALISNSAYYGGGGIENYYGTIKLMDSTLSGNTSEHWGGGIYNNYEFSTITLINSTLSDNSAQWGGGIYIKDGTLKLIDSTLSGNYASDMGGGFSVNYATLSLSGSTICSNAAVVAGGGILNHFGKVTTTNTTMSGNSASWGGAINDYTDAAVVLINSTVSGNSADRGAGGIDNHYYPLILMNAIVAGNMAPSNKNIRGYFTGTNNLINVVPLLAPLGDYGGSTQTMPPLPSSPAIDGGLDAGGLPATDQRGYPRIINGAVDIGACESFYITDAHMVASGCALEWMTCPTGWSSVVMYSTNLTEMPFVDLSGSLAFPANAYTDTAHSAEDQCFYRVEMVP